MITLIAAVSREMAIGRDGSIPWHMPEDLKFFRSETLGGALIMGRRTWESIGSKPLPGRMNFIVTSGAASEGEGYCKVPSVHEALEKAYGCYSRIYGAGGASIYRELLPRADRLLISHLELCVEGADTFFPEVNWDDWRNRYGGVLREANPRCIYQEFLRK